MAKNLTDNQRAWTINFLEKTVTPRFKKIIDEVNKMLNKKGIHIGVELTWYMDNVENVDEERKS